MTPRVLMLSVVVPTRDLATEPRLPPGADEVLLVGGNDGIAHAKNLGARATGGGILLFFDDDIQVEGNLNWFRTRPINENWWTGEYVDGTGEERTRRMVSGLNVASRLGLHAASIGPFLGVRRWLFDLAGGFPEGAVHEDTAFSRTLGRLGARLVVSPLVLTVRRPFTSYAGMWKRAGAHRGLLKSSTAPMRRLVPGRGPTPRPVGTLGSRPAPSPAYSSR